MWWVVAGAFVIGTFLGFITAAFFAGAGMTTYDDIIISKEQEIHRLKDKYESN